MHRATLLFVGFYGILLAERRCPASAAVMLPPSRHIVPRQEEVQFFVILLTVRMFLHENLREDSTMAVSYTHLDVYKRQQLDTTFHPLNLLLFLFVFHLSEFLLSWIQHFLFRRGLHSFCERRFWRRFFSMQNIDTSALAAAKAKLDAAAVSYTHLCDAFQIMLSEFFAKAEGSEAAPVVLTPQQMQIIDRWSVQMCIRDSHLP